MEIISAGNELDCLERVVVKKYACIAYSTNSRYTIARNFSDSETRKLVYSPDLTYNIFIGLAIQAGSIYKGSLEYWLSWTRPLHLNALWVENDLYYNVRLPKRQWWLETNQTDKLSRADKENSDDLTLKHISGSFLVLIGGLIICNIVFVLEIMYFNRAQLAGKLAVQLCKARVKVFDCLCAAFQTIAIFLDYLYHYIN
jgi:hypothetical protein